MDNTQNKTDAVEAPQPEAAGTSTFAVGSVMSLTLKTLFKNPIVFLGLGVLLYALERAAGVGLFFVWTRFMENMRLSFEWMSFYRHFVFLYLFAFIGLFFVQLLAGTITHGVFKVLKGNGASMVISLFHGLKRFVPLFCVAALYAFGIGLVSFLCSALGFKLDATLSALFMFILVFLPPAIMVCMWAAAVPICVAERLGAVKSLSRSAKLTDGYRMKIFGLVLILMIIAWVESIIMSDVPAHMKIMIPDYFAAKVFASAMIPAVYFELRKAKEGVAVENMTNVFN